MRAKLNAEKLAKLPSVEAMFRGKYGEVGTVSRETFDAKAMSWYYAEILKEARQKAGITQLQLATMIGKKREYIALLEKGETDMQLSTFLMISNVLGLKVSLTEAI